MIPKLKIYRLTFQDGPPLEVVAPTKYLAQLMLRDSENSKFWGKGLIKIGANRKQVK